MLTAPVSTGDPRRLELKLKEQLQGLALAWGRRMWLGSAESDMRAREATSPAMAARNYLCQSQPAMRSALCDGHVTVLGSAANWSKLEPRSER